uniref:RAD51-associated protein 1 isoform X1 n=1 Tax=Jaculus jaculus TaxID=51337 RepID=UPI001E1B3474|nr:RAD51-associated protein 1 isoform X1 [Jaculus jaculus]
MVRSMRKQKPVNYSQFEDSSSDDDFISATVPLNKKSKTVSKELKQEKPKPSPKNLQKEVVLPEKTPKKRAALDDKVFQRGLEVALALSVKELSTDAHHAQQSQDKSTASQDHSKVEVTPKCLRISNCSVASNCLDEVTEEQQEEEDARGPRGKRHAAAKAQAGQGKVLADGRGGDSAGDSEPRAAADEVSEQNADSEESEGDDELYSVRKSEAKETKKKEAKARSAAGKEEKKSKHRRDAAVTSVDPAPAAAKSESRTSPEAISLSPEATRKPAKMCSPSTESRRPKWVPPAPSGSSGGPLPGAAARSPSHSLRLGLSRLARVKPLHPNATSSQVW